jgi:hypothetical protein
MDAKQLGARLFMDCWDGGDFDVLDEILNSNHVFHLAEGDVVGIPAYRELLAGYYQAFNPTFELKHIIAEDNYAACHYTEVGRFSNDWVTSEGTYIATDQGYSTFGVELIHTSNGRILEAWPGHESLTHFTQAGLYEFKGKTSKSANDA